MIILDIIDWVFWVYMLMLFVRILGAWLPELQGFQAFRFVSFYTDPYLAFFRQFIPPVGMIDVSPIVAFFALYVIEMVVKGMAQMLLGL